jgi:hypothetical protein
MGAEATCVATFKGRHANGKARLETLELRFRGDAFTLAIPFTQMSKVGARGIRLLRDVARITERTNLPFITTFFGNPYTAAFVPELPATLLTYDFYDPTERAAVRAIAGEARIGGKLPITLSPQFKAGHGLDRPVKGM